VIEQPQRAALAAAGYNISLQSLAAAATLTAPLTGMSVQRLPPFALERLGSRA
jgi:hypothetical protein